MKKDRTLRRDLLMLILLVMLPLLTFFIITHLQMWRFMRSEMQAEIRQELDRTDLLLDTVLDKYSSLLQDFCTDDDVVELVEEIDSGEDILSVNSSSLRRRLSHICNRNEGVEGITLETADGRIFFYDRGNSSFVASSWASQVEVPRIGQGIIYQGGTGNDLYLIQIARRIVDYRNIRREIGTVVMSVDQNVIWELVHLKHKEDQIYICAGEQVIASSEPKMLHRNIKEADTAGMTVMSQTNSLTGWEIRHYHSMLEYNRSIMLWLTAGICYTGILMMVTIWLILRFTSPMLDQVNALTEGMRQVEQGDLSVQVQVYPGLQKEIRWIAKGFNDMVRRLEKMAEQIRISALEQKNAEISAMEAQIDPHFLYNTLDTINWKAIEREDYEISNMVGALADILRYSIRNPGDTVSIGQELYWLEEYIMLQKEKLEQPLTVEMDVPENLKTCRIHKLLLQPFVENAIRHGLYKKEGDCRLMIGMRQAGDQIHIMIQDNGKVMSEAMLGELNSGKTDMKNHVGIANVRKRLQLYYGEDAALYFESRQGQGTTVHLFVRMLEGEGGEPCES